MSTKLNLVLFFGGGGGGGGLINVEGCLRLTFAVCAKICVFIGAFAERICMGMYVSGLLGFIVGGLLLCVVGYTVDTVCR